MFGGKLLNNQSSQGGAGVWNGWHWRFIAIIVIALAILEVIAYEALHYQFIQSGELGMFIIAILIVQRIKERRTGNTMVAVISAWIINLIFQLTLGSKDAMHFGLGNFIQQNAIIGLIGILFCIVYARTTVWSDTRRKEAEAKRREKLGPSSQKSAEAPVQRVHRVKKKRGRGPRS